MRVVDGRSAASLPEKRSQRRQSARLLFGDRRSDRGAWPQFQRLPRPIASSGAGRALGAAAPMPSVSKSSRRRWIVCRLPNGRRAAALAGRALLAARRWPAVRRSSSINPFGRREIRDQDPARDVPAERHLRPGPRPPAEEGQRRRRQEVRRARQAISVLGMVAEGPADDDLRPLPGRRLRHAIASGKRYLPALSRTRRTRPTRSICRRCPTTTRSRTSRATRSSPPRRSTCSTQLVDQISDLGICRRRQVQDPGHARPARRQGDVGRPLLPEPAQLHRRHQPLPRGPGQVPDDAPHRGGAGAADRGLSGARHHQRGADRCGRARAQLPRQPLVQGRLRQLQADGLEPNEDEASWISRPTTRSSTDGSFADRQPRRGQRRLGVVSCFSTRRRGLQVASRRPDARSSCSPSSRSATSS